jgi:hypothetical protein
MDKTQRVPDAEFRKGRRGSYSWVSRGTRSFSFGDIEKVNRKSIVIINRKHPGEERITVDKALFHSVVDLESLSELSLVP